MTEPFLLQSNAVYNELINHVSKMYKHEHPETVLQSIQSIADIAWHAHPGHFADGRLENIAFEIGEELGSYFQPIGKKAGFKMPKAKKFYTKHVLHVASEIYNVGGHTRLIINWIKNDRSSTHSVLLTNQKSEIPEWFKEAVLKNGGHFIVFPERSPLISKACWLRKMVQNAVDMVILHHHPDDVVPVVALADRNCPPVSILNHADHVFWLGSSVADLVINLRPAGRELSKSRRFSKNNSILPIPLSEKFTDLSREEARVKLGLKNSDVMLLSVGSEFKYVPNQKYNFYETTSKILNQNPNGHLFLIGVSAESDGTFVKKALKCERFKCLGIIEDPFLYHLAADIYLEGFPFGSLTAMLEPLLLGVAPVLPYAPDSQVLMGNDVALSEKTYRAKDEADYISYVSGLIQNPEKRKALGREIRRKVQMSHAGEGWLAYLKVTYGLLNKIKHAPKPISNSSFLASVDDVALSKYHSAHMDEPILAKFISMNLETQSLLSIVKWFLISIKSKDMKSLQDLRRWISLIIEKIDKNDFYPEFRRFFNRLLNFNIVSKTINRISQGQ